MVTEARPFTRPNSPDNGAGACLAWSKAEVDRLTENQEEAYKRKALGLVGSQIAGELNKSPEAVKSAIVNGLNTSRGLNHMSVIGGMIEEGKIPQDELRKRFDVGRYASLVGKPKKIFDYMTNPAHWDEKTGEVANVFQIAEKTTRRHLTVAYKKLGVPNITAARVFALLLPKDEIAANPNFSKEAR